MRLSTRPGVQLTVGVVFLLASLSSWAQVAQRGGQTENPEINVTADKLSTGDGGTQIEATGNVVVKRQLTTLKADEVHVNRETQDVDAKGNVSADDPQYKINSADSLKFNMEKETGQIENGDLFFDQGHLSMTGRHLEKFSGQTYHVDEAFFTTCLCDSGRVPWRISADKMDLNPDGLGVIQKGYFYILDIPVLYLPYGFFPLKSERQTGLLPPKIGNSSKEGFRLQEPFFWAISKSTDATFALDVETRARIGWLGEFRTVFNRDSYFRLAPSYFNENLRTNFDVVDSTIADTHIPTNRWNIVGTHRYTTASDWLTYSDIAAYSDDLFTRELSDRFDLSATKGSVIQRSRFGVSRFGTFKNWDDTFFKGEWDFYQDFIQFDKTTLQRTPQISFWGSRFLAGFPLEFRWRAEGVNYLRRAGGSIALGLPETSTGDGDGLRFDLQPEVVLPFRWASYLFGSLSVAPRETVYHLYSAVTPSDHNVSRELVEVRGNVATSFTRIFAFNRLGLSTIKHVIEPEVSYLFVPGTNQTKIPIMDEIDRVNRRNVLTFAVSNRIWGKVVSPLAGFGTDKDVELLNPAVGNVRPLGSLRLALSYDIDKERHGGDTLSDLDMNLRLTPLDYLSLGLDSGFDPGPWKVSQARATFAISDPRPITRSVLDVDFNRPNSLGLTYSFLGHGPNSFLAENANVDCVANPSDPACKGIFFKNTAGDLSGNLIYHATDNIMLLFSSTYNVRDTRWTGVHAATKILSSCECWALTLSVSHGINPAKTSFNFNVNLLGLGGTQQSTLQ